MGVGFGVFSAGSEDAEKAAQKIFKLVGAYEMLRGGKEVVHSLHSAWMSYEKAVLAAEKAQKAPCSGGGLRGGWQRNGGCCRSAASEVTSAVRWGFALRHAGPLAIAAGAVTLGAGALARDEAGQLRGR